MEEMKENEEENPYINCSTCGELEGFYLDVSYGVDGALGAIVCDGCCKRTFVPIERRAGEYFDTILISLRDEKRILKVFIPTYLK